MDALAQLEATAKVLLHVVLAARTGVAHFPTTTHATPHEQLVSWCEHEAWLQRQVAEYRSHALGQLGKQKQLDVDAVYSELDQLQRQVLECTSTQAGERMLLQRLQENDVVVSCMFDGDLVSAPQRKQLQNVFAARDELAAKMLAGVRQRQELIEQLEAKQRESSRLRIENQQLAAQLEEDDEEEEQDELTHEIKSRLANREILKNVLRRLVLESGVNWAEDEGLMRVFLELE